MPYKSAGSRRGKRRNGALITGNASGSKISVAKKNHPQERPIIWVIVCTPTGKVD